MRARRTPGTSLPGLGLGLGVLALAPLALLSSCKKSSEVGSPSPAEDAGPDATMAATADASFPTPLGYDGAAPPPGARVPVQAELVSSRTDVQQLMFAAGEMQISGEPFAQHFAGRNLGDYDRTFLPTDQYLLPSTNDAGVFDPGFGLVNPQTDLFGYSTAVESYEYSKMHMNMVANQTTAGLSLSAGPILGARGEATPLARLVGRSYELLTNAGTAVALYAQLPAPVGNPLNYLGFTGLWPNFAPFRSFDPTMQPSSEVVQACTFATGYGGIPTLGSELPEFECAYNTLHLPNRDAQCDKTLVPAVLGFSTWKEGLWSIDFAGRLHDAASNVVNAVAASDRGAVGTTDNDVMGTDPPGAVPGTYLGSTPLEDMWGLFMLDEMDNVAEYLVSSLCTADGKTTGGFPSRLAATQYDYTSPLRWFPAATAVTEQNDDSGANPYPAIESLTITDATSRSVDLSALLLGNSMFFGETDPRNAGVGQRIGLLLTFDGDPFPADDGVADGEATAHDRSLAVLRVAFVDLDRMHTVPLTAGGAITVDTATVTNGVATPGTTVTTTNLGHVLIGLRQALLSLNGVITQYGAADPDPAADQQGILNPIAIHPPGSGTTPPSFSARVRAVFMENATLLRDVLTNADGSVVNGATVVNGVLVPTQGTATLDSQAAALRGLIEAFLFTNDPTFQARARLVATYLQTKFYSAPARMFGYLDGSTASGAADVTMTPEIFAWLQSALRETHKSLFLDGDPALGRDVLEDRIARVNKLFLNGWDDVNGDQIVNKVPDAGAASECLGARLQLGEQALTGELGRDAYGQLTSDRDSDCVLEIDGSQTGSLLASQVHFHSP